MFNSRPKAPLSALMKYGITLVVCLAFLTACLTDEEKRLQTDQAFEGEEMFRLSYSLDEHVAYAFYPMAYYRDSTNQSALPGCPTVVINELTNEVVLTFGQEDCATNRGQRSGKLILQYPPDTLLSEYHQVGIRYEDYWAKGAKIEGRRRLFEIDTLASDLALADSISDFIVTDVNRSTSTLSGVFLHELLMDNDTLQSYSTVGSAYGRNITGRSYTMEIREKKQFSLSCVQEGFQVAEGGQESWTFERTASRNVIHTMAYQQADDCNNGAQISLDDGAELIKNQ